MQAVLIVHRWHLLPSHDRCQVPGWEVVKNAWTFAVDLLWRGACA
jgi:hypothetical protein